MQRILQLFSRALRLSLVVGIGSDAWERLFGAPRPAGLHPFKELRGSRHHAPATPGDLLLHIRAQTVDMCFELAMQAMRALEGALARAEPGVVELRRDPAFAFPFFGLLAPLYDGTASLGAIWLVMDARTTLYPLLET